MELDLKQQPVASLSKNAWDCIIVGGGPAGALCAHRLAGLGRSVLVIDKSRFPRHKPCGDLLIPDAISVLRKAGLYERVRKHALTIDNISVFSPSRIQFDVPGEYLGISRYRFDALLVEAAQKAGATVAHGTVTDIKDYGGSVGIACGRTTLRAGICVIATGAAVELAMHAGLVERKQPSALAVRYYIKASEGPRDIVLSYDRDLVPGYGWIIPIKDGLFNIGCGVRLKDGDTSHPPLKQMQRKFEASFPMAAEIVRNGEKAHPLNGAALRCGLSGVKQFVDGRIVGVGEVVGTTYPFTGEGIGKAMETGIMAAEVINDSLMNNDMAALQTYGKRIKNEIKDNYRGYLTAEKYLGRPWLNDYLAGRIKKSRRLQRALSEFVAETGDPRKVYSPLSLLRSYWG